MAIVTPEIYEQLTGLAARLDERRKTILQTWRRAVKGDERLKAAATLPRAQFYDHIPEVLDAFAAKLRARDVQGQRAAKAEQCKTSVQHGLVRWQQGYKLMDVMRDWSHLHLCLVNELELDAAIHPEMPLSAMSRARVLLTELASEGVSESAQQYAKLTQTEAIGRVEGLESAMRRLTEMEQQRAQAWREAAHDLRGNLGVVKNATELLGRVSDSGGSRDRMMTLLKSGVDSLHALLNGLMDLARLEAGQEQLTVAPFDAAELLRDLCSNTHPLALERGLFLHSDGPASLPVSGDAVKLRRIAQNLILNALQYTKQGGVTVSWSVRDVPGAERWVLCVQDTGPGFSDGPVPPIAQALKQATDEAQSVEHTSEQATVPEQRIKRASTLNAQSGHRHQRAGEGIGLAIVKRVCELLDASLELETAPGKGSTFRVSLPLRYDSGAADASHND